MATPRVRIPSSAKKGEVIEIKTMLLEHKMETGTRKDESGKILPRKLINSFVCKFNGVELMRSNWATAVSENPYLAFKVVASESGKFEFEWHEDGGAIFKSEATITVG
jgi:sulfur-oxidizing protein SoxZ